MPRPNTPAAAAQVDSPLSPSGQLPTGQLPSGRRPGWVIIDWLLIVAALSSALWACRAAPVGVGESFQRTVVLDVEPHHPQTRWYIDSANVVCWSTGSAEGATSLRCATTSVPADVLVLVHPDSLMEPLVRTIEVLQQAGAQQVYVAISPNDPFPHSEPAPLP